MPAFSLPSCATYWYYCMCCEATMSARSVLDTTMRARTRTTTPQYVMQCALPLTLSPPPSNPLHTLRFPPEGGGCRGLPLRHFCARWNATGPNTPYMASLMNADVTRLHVAERCRRRAGRSWNRACSHAGRSPANAGLRAPTPPAVMRHCIRGLCALTPHRLPGRAVCLRGPCSPDWHRVGPQLACARRESCHFR